VFEIRNPLMGAIGALLSITTAHSAAAEEVAEVIELDPMTVTATRTERSAFAVPESVSVIDAGQMETDQVSNFGDILESLPNVDISSGPRPIGEGVVIRGLSDRRILFLMDGARKDFTSGHKGRVFLEPDLLKQVEVLRGPASSLWGSGALGGVVAFTTKDATDLLEPSERFGFRMRGGFQGVNNEWLGGGTAFGQPVDSFDYLASFAHRSASDLEQGDGTTLEHSAYDSQSGLLKLNWWPLSDHHLSFTMQGYNQDGEVPTNPAASLGASYGILLDRNTRQYDYVLRYRYENAESRYLLPEAIVYHTATGIDEELIAPPEKKPRLDETELATFGFGLRNSMEFGDTAQLGQMITLGVDYFEDNAEATRNGAPRPESPDGRLRVLGAYVQDEVTLFERWSAILGLRYDDYAASVDSGKFRDREESELSLRAGLGWDVTDWLSLHGAYGEAFRAPNVNELFVSGTHFSAGLQCQNVFVPNPNLRPEKAHNKEAGLRIKQEDLFQPGDKARFRFAYFINDVDDFIDTVVDFLHPPPCGITTVRNVRNAALEGFEAEFTYDAPWYFAGLTYGQTRGEGRDTGEPLSAIPPDKWVATVGLRAPAWGATLGWRTTFVEGQDQVPTGDDSTPGYTVHDFYLSWLPDQGPWRGLRFDFGVDNLTDKGYRRHLAVLPEAGVNIKTSLSYSF
jgi:hemoglobin/transferrin/lactoferrin receptor protein